MKTEKTEPIESLPRFRRWSRRIAIELGYLLFLFVLLEGTLRVAGFIWLLPRTLSQQGVDVKRDEIRILAVGESTTFGQGVPSESAYPKVLERLLKDNLDGTFRVINTGIPGQTSTSILRNIRFQMDKHQPHIVLALFGINDMNEALNDLSSRVAFGMNVPEWVAHLRTYRLACVVRDYAIHAPKLEDHGAWTFFDREQKDEDGNWVDNPFFLDQLSRNTSDIIEAVHREGGEYVMVSYLRSNEKIRETFRVISEEEGVLLIDVLQDQDEGEELLSEDGFHPNEEGHRLMAERIYEGFMERDLLLKITSSSGERNPGLK